MASFIATHLSEPIRAQDVTRAANLSLHYGGQALGDRINLHNVLRLPIRSNCAELEGLAIRQQPPTSLLVEAQALEEAGRLRRTVPIGVE